MECILRRRQHGRQTCVLSPSFCVSSPSLSSAAATARELPPLQPQQHTAVPPPAALPRRDPAAASSLPSPSARSGSGGLPHLSYGEIRWRRARSRRRGRMKPRSRARSRQRGRREPRPLGLRPSAAAHPPDADRSGGGGRWRRKGIGQ